ncbi:P-loop containing nucleoside triphosphate hydrolase protein [Mycena floridula]|nr:P-loop containing nucleoside triphosphate hydrolase protein [Mycena floridula]
MPASTAKVPLEFDPTKTQLQLTHYLKAYQLYHERAWIPYDPSAFVPETKKIEAVNPDNFFNIVMNYQSPADTPRVYLSKCSSTLSHFFRAFIGGSFFSSNSLYEIKKLFPELSGLRQILSQSRLMATANLDEKVEFLSTIGRNDLINADEATATATIVEFSEHLAVLMQFIEEEFKPIGDKLALVTAYGHIEFELLMFLFQPGQHLVTLDDEGQPIAFRVKSRSIEIDILPVFIISGKAKRWNGSQYESYKVHRKVGRFEDTVAISSLPFQEIKPEIQEKLRVRGAKYTAYSGVHYRLYNGARVMIDKVAYDRQGGYTRDPNQIIPELDDDLLHLLPSNVVGFNLATKKWQSFLVDQLSPVTFDENAWDHLVLEPDVKTLIKGLVAVTKNANSSEGAKIIGDVISGKGGGLIAVLHGPPGTGKTLTAESVAETLRRPLYMVGSSELPSTASSLETSLKSVLKLATAWDAVLLIDEADVYLEQRSLHEVRADSTRVCSMVILFQISRNALVSVALRVLEYHRGVLFLTTNRIKTFDEAFLSRFSIAVKFPELDQAGRLTVWSKFLEMAGCRIVSSELKRPHEESDAPVLLRRDLETLALKEFNGRTIKNLVRTAQALALSCETNLSSEHIMVVVRAQEKFLDQFTNA